MAENLATHDVVLTYRIQKEASNSSGNPAYEEMRRLLRDEGYVVSTVNQTSEDASTTVTVVLRKGK